MNNLLNNLRGHNMLREFVRPEPLFNFFDALCISGFSVILALIVVHAVVHHIIEEYL